MMISRDKLMRILTEGRHQCYVKKSADYNPYVKSDLYDWEFKIEIDGFIYVDSYRGFNPYNGVEYIYIAGNDLPIWSCDYVGYAASGAGIPAGKIYEFLKEARGSYLMNCDGNLFSDYQYENGKLLYRTYFQGDVSALLQIENFFHGDKLVAQQVASGRLKLSYRV